MGQTTNFPGMNPQAGMYQRTGNAPAGGTVVPGMQNNAPGVEVPPQQKTQAPVVGFLYSISRNGIGEYWPVCIGNNTIGRDPECSICLREGTVTGRHAELNVKVLRTSGKIVAQIHDIGSKNGIMVNNEELDFGYHPCQNNDILRIGNNYQLLLILINTAEYGLGVAEDFVATEEDSFDTNIPPFDNFTDSPYNPANRAAGGTQAMDGVNDFTNGGTKIL